MKKQILIAVIVVAAAVVGHAVFNTISESSYEVATGSSGSSCDPAGANGGGGDVE